MSLNENDLTSNENISDEELSTEFRIDLIKAQDKISQSIKDGYVQNLEPESLLSKDNNKNGDPKRPPNANIIFSNMSQKLGTIGTLNIAEKVCMQYKFSLRKKMTIARRLGGILWKGLPSKEKEPFNNLAARVDKLHKEMYPEYKLVKRKRNKKGTISFKPYDESKAKKRSSKTTKTQSKLLPTTPFKDEIESVINHTTQTYSQSLPLNNGIQSLPTLLKDEVVSVINHTTQTYSQSLISASLKGGIRPHSNHACQIDAQAQQLLAFYTASNASEELSSGSETFPTFVEPPLLVSSLCTDRFQNFENYFEINEPSFPVSIISSDDPTDLFSS